MSATEAGPDAVEDAGAPSDRVLVHHTAADRLAGLEQRYTMSRRTLVEALYGAGRPLTIPELLAEAGEIPQSSAYRNLSVLCEAGVARRLPGPDDFGRFELAEDLAGHHHHLRCTSCGSVVDFIAPARLERALMASAGEVASSTGFELDGHSVEFSGRCPRCR